MKKLILIIALTLSINVFAKDADKIVTIVVSGQGKTQDEAKQVALRSAIEQAFGTFISSKTEILNDQVVSDQIASVANGNIQSFNILNESQLPDGTWGVTLKAIVSVDKLTSFVEAKGIAIEIKGGMFAMNIKQQLLNEQGEVKAIKQMVGLLHEPLQISFDYAIKNGKPKSLDAESKNWEIPLEVTATANKNMDFCANYCMKTLDALSLSKEEVRDYQNLNKPIYPITINFKKFTKIYYLRKESSMNALSLLTDHWAYYTHLFIVQPEMGLLNGRVEMQIHDFSINRKEGKTINFLTSGQQAATFSWQDKRTLTQIEQLTSYTVKPKGVISQFKHDNFVVYDENGLEFVEQMPECLDGNNTLFADILNNLNYPKNAVDANVEGSVHINFVVNVDGSISDIQLVLGIGYGCDEEALRVIRKLSKCVPRTKDGNPVSTRFNLKITFDLD